jgi:xylulokinase
MGAEIGKMTVSAGSYECASIVTDKPLNDKNGFVYGLNSYCHVIPDKYLTLAFFASGLIVNWFVDKLCPFAVGENKNIYSVLESLAPTSPTGICFTPHLYGSMNPKWDDGAKAVISGITGEAGIGHLYRALLEGAACELNLNLNVLEQLSSKIESVVLCGGGTRSNLWMQIRADILNKPLSRIEGSIDASCIGAAILAGVGSGTFDDYKQAVDKIKYTFTEFTPKNTALYEKQKENYNKIH